MYLKAIFRIVFIAVCLIVFMVYSEIKVYSVDEITTYLQKIIELDRNLQDIWVKGEISNLRRSDSHIYFNLKDEDSIIDCAMFHRANKNLEFVPEEGIKVIIRGSLEVYKKKGRYQIIVEEMQPAGKGELYLKFLQLKDKLEKEGLFREEIKKPIPRFPRTIGIVSSLDGAAIRDIIKTIKHRYPHVKLLVFPSFVQGDEAKFSLSRGIEVLNQLNVDIIILARGGGSFEDLWPFNEEIVVRAISNSKIPIITGIGHEVDFTLSDFAADKRAHTPSAAAELAVPDEAEVLNTIEILKNNLCKRMLRIAEYYKQQMYYLLTQFRNTAMNKIEILKMNLENYDGKLNALSPYAILNRGYSLTLKKGKIVSSIKNINKGEILSTIVKDGEIESEVKAKN